MLHEYLTTDHALVRKIVKGFGIEQIVGRAEDFEAKYWNLAMGRNPTDATSPGSLDPRERFQELEVIKRQREESKLRAYNFIRKITELANVRGLKPASPFTACPNRIQKLRPPPVA